MGIGRIVYNGEEIICLDFEGVEKLDDKIAHLRLINSWVGTAKKDVLVLINLKGFMADHEFMEYATSSIMERAEKIKKAAYIGLEKVNKKSFEYFDRYNKNIVTRMAFKEKQEALIWLTTTPQ